MHLLNYTGYSPLIFFLQKNVLYHVMRYRKFNNKEKILFLSVSVYRAKGECE